MDQLIPMNDAADVRPGNWTIKHVPLRTRLAARESSSKAGKPMWQWLEWAVDTAQAQQARNSLGPTSTAYHFASEGQPPPVELKDLMTMAALPLPRWLSSRVNRMLGEALGVAPPPPSRKLLEKRTQMAQLPAPQPVEPNDARGLAA